MAGGACQRIGNQSSLCCCKGKVELPAVPPPPEPLKSLLENTHPKAKTFLKDIRLYNSALQMASSAINQVPMAGGPSNERIGGSVHHMAGPLHPRNGEPPRFAQLYVYDNDNELQNRLQAFPNGAQCLDADLLQQLQTMLHRENHFVRTFRAAASAPMADGKIVFHCDSGLDQRRYNVPTSAEVAGVLPEDADEHVRDIVVHYHDERRCWRISDCYPAYMPLHFVLLFPYGEHRWTLNIPHADVQQQQQDIYVNDQLEDDDEEAVNHHDGVMEDDDNMDAPEDDQEAGRNIKTMSLREYAAFRLQVR